jgi:hypothetical protein
MSFSFLRFDSFDQQSIFILVHLPPSYDQAAAAASVGSGEQQPESSSAQEKSREAFESAQDVSHVYFPV